MTYFKKSNDYGWQGGIFIEHCFFKNHISIEVDLKAFRYENHITGNGNYHLSYTDKLGIRHYGSCSNDAFIQHSGFTLPILIKYNIKNIHPFIGVQFEKSNGIVTPDQYYGKSLAWNDSYGNIQTYADRIKITPSKSDYGILAGLEYDINQTVGIRISYLKGMNDAVRYDFTTGILNDEGGTKFSESTRKEMTSLSIVFLPNWHKIKLKKMIIKKELPLKIV